MRRATHHRKVERIRLFPSIDAIVDREWPVQIEELSLLGARIRYYQPIVATKPIDLSFIWRDRQIDIQCEIVRTHEEQFGINIIYHSGLRFLNSMGASVFSILQLITEYVEDVLERQIANAEGRGRTAADADSIARLLPDAEERARLRIQADRDEGFVRYCYTAKGWERENTWDSAQPQNGFTIWSFEDTEQVDELCRIFEKGDADTRALIQVCAELSLFTDDTTLPPQSFAL